jgi:hypothetical protein
MVPFDRLGTIDSQPVKGECGVSNGEAEHL